MLQGTERLLGGGVRRGLFYLIHEAPCSSTRDVVFAEDFLHCFEAFLDRFPCRCAVAAEHVVLVLVLQAAAGTQGIGCAPVDLFLLVSDV